MSSIKTGPRFEEESYCNFAAFLHSPADDLNPRPHKSDSCLACEAGIWTREKVRTRRDRCSLATILRATTVDLRRFKHFRGVTKWRFKGL